MSAKANSNEKSVEKTACKFCNTLHEGNHTESKRGRPVVLTDNPIEILGEDFVQNLPPGITLLGKQTTTSSKDKVIVG